ncbi:hypothetical protein [Caballeronia sp. KNU42]|jgi:hypothetical protein
MLLSSLETEQLRDESTIEVRARDARNRPIFPPEESDAYPNNMNVQQSARFALNESGRSMFCAAEFICGRAPQTMIAVRDKNEINHDKQVA